MTSCDAIVKGSGGQKRQKLINMDKMYIGNDGKFEKWLHQH